MSGGGAWWEARSAAGRAARAARFHPLTRRALSERSERSERSECRERSESCGAPVLRAPQRCRRASRGDLPPERPRPTPLPLPGGDTPRGRHPEPETPRSLIQTHRISGIREAQEYSSSRCNPLSTGAAMMPGPHPEHRRSPGCRHLHDGPAAMATRLTHLAAARGRINRRFLGRRGADRPTRSFSVNIATSSLRLFKRGPIVF